MQTTRSLAFGLIHLTFIFLLLFLLFTSCLLELSRSALQIARENVRKFRIESKESSAELRRSARISSNGERMKRIHWSVSIGVLQFGDALRWRTHGDIAMNSFSPNWRLQWRISIELRLDTRLSCSCESNRPPPIVASSTLRHSKVQHLPAIDRCQTIGRRTK